LSLPLSVLAKYLPKICGVFAGIAFLRKAISFHIQLYAFSDRFDLHILSGDVLALRAAVMAALKVPHYVPSSRQPSNGGSARTQEPGELLRLDAERTRKFKLVCHTAFPAAAIPSRRSWGNIFNQNRVGRRSGRMKQPPNPQLKR